METDKRNYACDVCHGIAGLIWAQTPDVRWRGPAQTACKPDKENNICHNRGTAGLRGCDAIVFSLGDPPSYEQTSCDARWEPYFVLTRALSAPQH